jgi:lysophospholipase L1-like esterase
MGIQVDRSSRLLFIGDSITDCARNADPEGIGQGYVRLVRDSLLAKDPARAPAVINRGISGNKITDLASRWERDVIEMSPAVVSILVGVNDVWHGLMPGGVGVPADEYARVYREIVAELRRKRPACQIVLCEPTVIWPPQDARAQQMLQPYVHAVHDLAGKIEASCLVPLNAAFEKARQARPDVVWAPDGVHPSSAGHMLIAQTWLQAAGLL